MYLHMSIFFVTLQPDFCAHMNACESARTRDAKDACKTKKNRVAGSGGKRDAVVGRRKMNN